MGQRIKGIIRYDGTDFAGWQVQPDQRTVQGVLEEALGKIAGAPMRVISAGRTDSGTHALGQVFCCDWTADVPLDDLRRRLSQMLLPEVRIESIEAAPDDFHATWHAKSKRYAYVVNVSREPDPFAARYSWCVFRDDLDRTRIEGLAQRLTGKHDFAGYTSNGATVEDTVRTIHSVKVLEGPAVGPQLAPQTNHQPELNESEPVTPTLSSPRKRGPLETPPIPASKPTGPTQPATGIPPRSEYLRLEFEGDGFLYKMVRNLTGTLIDIARDKLPESTLDERLHDPGPYLGFTAPAKGLFLVEVKY